MSPAPVPEDYPGSVRLDVWRTVDSSATVYRLTITDDGMNQARLDGFDRALLAECDEDDATVSDRLLGLETVVRRIEQAASGNTDA